MMQNLSKFLFFLLFIFILVPNAYGARINDSPNYYSSVEAIPPTYKDPCPVPCGQPVSETCWNGSTPGVKVACGDACVRGGGETQRSWTRYVYAQSTCRYDPELSLLFGDTVCTPMYTISGETCSTADKYNISSYGSGDTTMLRAGSCTCTQRELYKTCCNGTNAVDTYQAGGNPQFPDGGCQFTTRACGSDPAIYAELGQPFTNVSCGQAACATCTAGQACTGTGGCAGTTTCPSGSGGPSSCVCNATCTGTALSCTNPQCPSGYTLIKLANGNYTCSNTSTGQLDCSGATAKPFCPTGCPTTGGYTGESCACGSGNIATTCASDPKCNNCSLKYCLRYASTLCCYYNEPTCFKNSVDNCKNFGCGADKCIPGSTKTTCSAPNVCPAP